MTLASDFVPLPSDLLPGPVTAPLVAHQDKQNSWIECRLHRCFALQEASVLLHLAEDAVVCTGNVPEGGEAEAKPAAEEPQKKEEPKEKSEPAPKKAEPAAKPAPEKKPEKKPEPPKQASPAPPVRPIRHVLRCPNAACETLSAMSSILFVNRHAAAYWSSQHGHSSQKASV